MPRNSTDSQEFGRFCSANYKDRLIKLSALFTITEARIVIVNKIISSNLRPEVHTGDFGQSQTGFGGGY